MKMNYPREAAGIAAPQTDAAVAPTPNAGYGAGIANLAVTLRAGLLDRLAPAAIAIPFLAACGTLLFIVNLGAYPLYTKGESREAVTVFDIARGGGVILPMRAGVE